MALNNTSLPTGVAGTNSKSLPLGNSGGGAVGKILLIKPDKDAVQYTTFALVNAAAVAGDSVLVFNGIYNENDITKAGVFYHFSAGAKVEYSGVDLTPVISAGSDIHYVLGEGEFKSSTIACPVWDTAVSGTLNLEALKVTQDGLDTIPNSGTLNMDIKETILNSSSKINLGGTVHGSFGKITKNGVTGAAMDVSCKGDIKFDTLDSDNQGLNFISNANSSSWTYNNITAVGNALKKGSAFTGIANFYCTGVSKSTGAIALDCISSNTGVFNHYGKIESATNAAIFMNTGGFVNLYGEATGGNVSQACISGYSGRFELKEGGRITAASGRAFETITGGGGTASYRFYGKIDHTHSGSTAVFFTSSQASNKVFGSSVEIVTNVANTNSIDGGVGKTINVHPGAVTNKAINAVNVAQQISTFIVNIDVV